MNVIIRRANLSDIENIYKILTPYAEDGVILARSQSEIHSALDTFFIAALNNETRGVISFYDYGNGLKEVRSLAVKKEYTRHGIGSLLVKHLISYLLEQFPETRIFVLSYHPAFFKTCNFNEISKELLPEKIWKDCQNCKKKDNCNETALIYSKS